LTYHNTFTQREVIKLFSINVNFSQNQLAYNVKSPTSFFDIIIDGPLALKLDGAVCLSRAKLLDILFYFPISTGISGIFYFS
jgi:hypothetical protein